MTDDILARAKDSPYGPPSHPYLFVDGEARPLPAASPATSYGEPRLPIIAIGSNRAPAQLARKFSGWPVGTAIPVSVGWLADHDVVYSGHFARYGALPAWLAQSPGTRVEVGVTWLTDRQLSHMHGTEGPHNYSFERLKGLDLRLDDGVQVSVAFAYLGKHRPFLPDGEPIPLAAISAEGRTARALDQRAVLARARDVLAPETPLDTFILETVADDALRARRTRALQALTGP